MSETGILTAFVAILLGISLMTSAYLTWATGTPYGMDFPLGRYFYNGGNYTVSQSFQNANVTAAGIGLKEIKGQWAVDSIKGLYPTELWNNNWLPLTYDYEARATFGTVRYVNNSWEESYYLKNINMAASDTVGIVIKTGTYQNSLFFPGSYEMILSIRGDQVSVKENNYVAGLNIGGNEFPAFTIPGGATEGKISYKAVAVGWRKDAATMEHIIDFNVEAYWNDTKMALITYDNFQMVAGSDLMTRSADIRTNIGAPATAYELNIISHYEVVTVQDDTSENDPLQYGEINKFLIILGDVLLWGVPLETPIPTWILMFIIGVPEFIIGYIIARLIRGGG
jgi:hypothetical protein